MAWSPWQRAGAALAPVAAVALYVAARPPAADPGAEARLAALRAEYESEAILLPHAVRPGGTPIKCQTGLKAAEALRDFPAVGNPDRLALAAFVDHPTNEAAQVAFPVLQRLEPGMQQLLDAAYCAHVVPVPAGFAGRLAGITPFVAAQARALVWAGDFAGASRWALDLCALGQDFRKGGGFAEYEAGTIALAEGMGLLGPLLVDPSAPKGFAAQVVDELGALLDHDEQPGRVVERERLRVRGELIARIAPAAELLAQVDAYDARMDALSAAFALPPESRYDALDAWRAEEPTVLDPVDLDRDALDLEVRGRGLMVVAALVRWRESHDECPLTLNALREGLSKDATRNGLGGDGVVYVPSPCHVAAMRPDGSTVDAWGIP